MNIGPTFLSGAHRRVPYGAEEASWWYHPLNPVTYVKGAYDVYSKYGIEDAADRAGEEAAERLRETGEALTPNALIKAQDEIARIKKMLRTLRSVGIALGVAVVTGTVVYAATKSPSRRKRRRRKRR